MFPVCLDKEVPREMARLRRRGHARNISTALDTTSFFPLLLQEWEAAAQFHRRSGMPPCPSRAGWVQEKPVPRQAEGWFLGSVTSATARCCTQRSARPSAPSKGGRHRGPLPRAWAVGAPRSPMYALQVPVPKDSCGTAGWWHCPGASCVLGTAVPRQTKQFWELWFAAGVFAG